MAHKKRVEKHRKWVIFRISKDFEKDYEKFKQLTLLDDRLNGIDKKTDANGRRSHVLRTFVLLYNEKTLKYLQNKQQQKEVVNETNQNTGKEENISPITTPDNPHVAQ